MSQPQADVEVFRDYFNNSFLLHFDPRKNDKAYENSYPLSWVLTI